MSKYLYLVLIICALTACFNEQNPDEAVSFNGPFVELDTIETLYSDSAVLKIKLQAPKQLEYQSGDRDFPKGLYIEFYDEVERGKKTATLKANSGTFKKATNIYTVRGNVIIENIVEKKSLKTEELHWYPETKKINTEKFVRIEGPDQILTGTGLDANQDFSSYTIHHVEGIFPVEE